MRPTARHLTHSHRPLRRGRVARWRTSTLEPAGHETERDLRLNLFFCLVLASGYGRGLRMLTGGLLISLGASAGGGIVTTLLAAIGLATMLEAMFDLCLIAPLLGCPTDGIEIRRRAALSL